jgi:hypothetical protein
MRTITRKGRPSVEEQEALRLLQERHGIPPPSADEQAIVEDIVARTNWYVQRLGGYETSDEEVARDVLSILLEWFPRVAGRDNWRGAIYYRFCTPYAKPYIEILMQWYLQELDKINHMLLESALICTASAEHAQRLWQLCRHRSDMGLQLRLAVKLCRFPSVAAEIKDFLVEWLNRNPSPLHGELQCLLNVRDPRIFAWFKEQLNAPSAGVRSLARRYVERGAKLPAGLAYAEIPPERLHEIYSWEIDLAELQLCLKEVARTFCVTIPARIRSGRFLDTAELDRWLVTQLSREDSRVSLWFRLEDYDTVEIVLIRQHVAPSSN